MFRRDRIGRGILYIKAYIQAYKTKLEREANCDEAVWCNIVTGNSILNVGLVYQSPNKRSYEQKLACNLKMRARVFMHISGLNKSYETRLAD